jgi:hypothetical protein
MTKLFTKLALAAALAAVAMAGSTGDTFARGYKAKPYCALGSWRVTKSTCGSWGCHFQKCVYTGAPTTWMITPAFCVHPWCPKY